MEGDAEADFDGEEAVCGGELEDLEGVFEVEFLAYDGGGVDLDAGEGELLLVFGQELGFVRGLGEPPVGDEGEEDGERALDEEEVAPAF